MPSLWMLIAGLLSASMGYFVKLGSVHFSTVELIFYRSIFGTLLMGIIMHQQRQSFKTKALRVNFLRGITGLLSLFFYYSSIKNLPLSMAMTLFYTAPVFVAIFTALVLGAKANSKMLVPVLAGFAGITLLLQPSVGAGGAWEVFLGLLSGLLGAFAYLNVKALGRLGEPESRVVFYYSVVCVIGTGAALLFSPARLGEITLKGGLILLGLGVTSNLAQLAMTAAYSRGNTFLTSSLSYCAVVFSFGFGMIFFDETLSLSAVAATILIIFSGIMSFMITHKKVLAA